MSPRFSPCRLGSSARLFAVNGLGCGGLVCLLALVGALIAGSAAVQVTLDSSLVLVIDPREPAAIQKAAADLSADFARVFGQPVRVVENPAEAGATAVCIAFQENMPAGTRRPVGYETLLIQTFKNPWPSSPVKNAVLLTGSDVRGTIYAIYEFSRRFLGVDPFYWWTDHIPPRRTSIIVPTELREAPGPPTFKYRGWFINAEDLLSGWKPGTADGTGISLQVWDRVFEALLRSKGNMIIPGTFIFPDEPQVRAATERGLVISQHHIEILGLNTYRWPADRPYSLLRRPDLLEAAWRTAVRQYGREQEVIWTVGLRGQSDYPYWDDDPGAPADAAGRARLIRSAIDQQLEIVRHERTKPYVLMNAWMEAADFVSMGLLQIPPGVTLVWPDNGHGLICDAGKIQAGQGVYYHTSMHNNVANQFTEMVPPERIRRELSRAVRAGATEYLLVNTSNLRPVVMTTRAVMELAWNAEPWNEPGYERNYLERWIREEFGADAIKPMLEYYGAYFPAPGRYGSEEHQTFGDNAYYKAARELATWLAAGKFSPSPRLFFTQARDLNEYGVLLAAACRQADPRWQTVMELAEKALPAIPSDRRDFFQAQVLMPATLHLHSNRMLLRLAEAAQAPPNARADLVAAAATEAGLALAALESADYGKWAGFYASDRFIKVRYVGEVLQTCTAILQGKPVALPPPTPVTFKLIKAYQGDREVEFR